MKKLGSIYDDLAYIYLVEDILNDEKFKKISTCRHHGMTRFDHSLRVSYYSYLIAKKLKLDYVSTARGGLLHDFFLDEELTPRKKKLSLFFHPYLALENAKKTFNLNDMEEDIIINHMFPSLPHKIPKYLESWLVSSVDKVIATYEFYFSYGRKYLYRFSNLYILLLLLR